MNDDAELLGRYAAADDEAAFAKFVRRHIDLVYSAALRRTNGNPSLAGDVAQQVFLATAQRAKTLAGHPALTGWLYLATRNASYNLMRDEKRRLQLARSLHEGGETPDLAAADADWGQLRPELDGAMDELKDTDRHAILLRFFEDRSFAEMGETLQLTENAARMRVERALERLRSGLARRGVTSTAAALGLAISQHGVMAAPAELAAGVTTGVLAGAGGAVAVGITGGVVTFMSINKIVLVSAAVVAALGVGVAFREARIATRVTDELAALRRGHESAQTKSSALEERLAMAEKSSMASAGRVAALTKELETAKKTDELKSAAINPSDRFRNPDYARAYVEKFRAEMGLKYLPLYRSLHLTPEQVEKFEAALVEAEQGIVEIWAEASIHGMAAGTGSAAATSISRLTSEPLRARNESLKATLGDDAFGEFQQFEKNRSPRDTVTSLAASLYSTENPLTGVQGDAVTAMLAANTQTVKIPMTDDGKSPLYRMADKTDWAAVEAQARSTLSPAQLAILHAIAEQRKADEELRRLSQ